MIRKETLGSEEAEEGGALHGECTDMPSCSSSLSLLFVLVLLFSLSLPLSVPIADFDFLSFPFFSARVLPLSSPISIELNPIDFPHPALTHVDLGLGLGLLTTRNVGPP